MSILQGLEFDDVLVIPKPSSVNSRLDVDTSVDFKTGLHLELPIIAAPMKGIISKELIVELSRCGAMGIMHRFYTTQLEWIDEVNYIRDNCKNWGISVGLTDDLGRVDYALSSDTKIICVDVANGYTKAVVEFVAELANYIHDRSNTCLLMAGNVCEAIGTHNLISAGADMIRVGIGGGALCTTRNVTGVGMPQFTAVQLATDELLPGNYIISDGGIKSASDIIKALVAGADAVMIGTMFGQCYESAHNGIIYGMASEKLQGEYYHNTKSIEGIARAQMKLISTVDLLTGLTWNMRSAMTYLNAQTLSELYDCDVVRVGCGSIKSI